MKGGEKRKKQGGEGWLSLQRTLLLRQHSVFKSRHPSKIINGRKSSQHTLAHLKIFSKKIKNIVLTLKIDFVQRPDHWFF
jgi:hypothetical protein